VSENGFTLTELLYVLLLASILLLLGLPGLSRHVHEVRRTADINAFVTAIHLARSESAKRGISVQLCPSSNGFACTNDDGDFTPGWIVLADSGGAAGPKAPSREVLFTHSPQAQSSISANRALFEFRPNYRRSTNGTVTFCDLGGVVAARAVIVSYTGRPRVAGSGPGGQALLCAG
jgi:type IV fimbrial biogenesis protein FimT